MSVYPENRFVCDRCRTSVNMPMASAPPTHARAAGPDGWMTLSLGADPSSPPSHFCPECTGRFKEFVGRGREASI